MDILKQLGRQVRKTNESSEHNTRRVAEKFPQVERKTDTVSFDASYKMEFEVSDHKHSVHLSLYIKPPASCFQCNIQYNAPDVANATAILPTFGPGDGLPYPGIYSAFSTNVHTGIDPFELGAGGGIVVPMDGVYTAQFVTGTTGVTVSNAAGVIASVRHNGIIKAQQIFTVVNGKLPPAPQYMGADVNLYGLCIECRAGDTLEGWMLGSGIAFYNPNNIGYLTVRLVAYL